MDRVKYDVDYPKVNLGHYIALISNLDKNCYHSVNKDLHAILMDDYFEENSEICFITFYAFGNYRSTLKVYVNFEEKNLLLKKFFLKNEWRFFKLSLKKYRNKRFQIIFSSFISYLCEDTVGIDKIEYKTCKYQTPLKIFKVKNTKFMDCQDNCMSIINNHQENNRHFYTENLIFHQNIPIKQLVSFDIFPLKLMFRNLRFNSLQNIQAIKILIKDYIGNYLPRKSLISFTHNTIENIDDSRILDVQNNNVNSTLVKFHKNHIISCKGSDILFRFQKTDVDFLDNFIFNCTMEKEILHLDNQDSFTSIINSSFYFNIVQAKNKGLIHSKCNDVQMNKNLFLSPNKNFDFSTEVTKNDLINGDLSNNWWNTKSEFNVEKRIYDGRSSRDLAIMTVRPILKEKPNNIYTSQICPYGWLYLRGICFYIHMGADTQKEAIDFCVYHSSFLISATELDSFPQIRERLHIKNLNGYVEETIIWTDDSLPSENSLRPWVCRKDNEGLCPNNCFGRGICIGKTCVCKSGWIGSDCSEFNCEKVSNCSNRGECTGPNICQCIEGWTGKNCATSYCSRYVSCNQCTRQNGCGWCDSMQKCIPGSPRDPFFSCHHWFFYSCLSLDNHNCSSQIHELSCNHSLCSKEVENLIGKCIDCKKLIECFDEGDQRCFTWNETRCEGGTPKPENNNPDDESYEKKDNVIEITTDTKIFRCISHEDLLFDKNNEYEILFIPTAKRIVQEGQIVYSRQSRGIVHKIEKLWQNKANYLTLLTKFVNPLNILNYVYTKIEMNNDEIQNPKSIDRVPTEEEMHVFQQSNQTFKEINDADVFKCTGKEYSYNGKSMWSYNILTKFSNFELDDLLMFNKPKGYLEKVLQFQSTEADIFVETELLDCSKVLDKSSVMKLDTIQDAYPIMECDAGDSMKGLLYNEKDKFKKVLENDDLIIGRSALPSLGFVVNSQKLDTGWYQIEILDLSSISSSMHKSDFSRENVTERKRSKRSSFSSTFSGPSVTKAFSVSNMYRTYV